MPNGQPPAARTACPHCGKPPGLKWWYLLPSSNSRRVLTCAQCGQKYDLSDAAKMASIIGGLLGMGPAIYLLGKIVQHGHGKAAWVLLGTAAAGAVFMAMALLLSGLTLRLVRKS